MTRSRARGPTIKDQLLISLLMQGPATQVQLADRLHGHLNANTIRRELADMVAHDDVQVSGHIPGGVGRAAYIYAHHETYIPDGAPVKAAPSIRPSTPEIEIPIKLFGDEPIPAHALKLNPEYQLLWRNGLRV